MPGVYAVINIMDGRNTSYIGSTGNSVRARFGQHRSKLKLGKHHNPHMQSAWDAYGPDVFEFVILDEMENADDVLNMEQIRLDEFRLCVSVYNNVFTIVEHGVPIGHRFSEEALRNRRPLMGKDNPNYGKECTERNKAALRQSNTGNEFNARPYPALIHKDTGEIIPAGFNLAATCRDRGLNTPCMQGVASGRAISYKGWMLVSGSRVSRQGQGADQSHKAGNEYQAKSYPQLRHTETEEIIPAGHNMAALARTRDDVSSSGMGKLVNGNIRTHRGWAIDK